jgi:hypothetical protein
MRDKDVCIRKFLAQSYLKELNVQMMIIQLYDEI